MKFEDFQNEAQFKNYCILHGDEMPLRVQVNGRWQTKALADLPADEQDAWIADWWQRGLVATQQEPQAPGA